MIVVIVIVVIFLFLASLRSVIIPVVTIPLSLIGVCALMMAAGFSFNLLTLLAMVLVHWRPRVRRRGSRPLVMRLTASLCNINA